MFWLVLNPYNLAGIPAAPQVCNHDYWQARFEREGREAPMAAANPYNVGTMAADCWNAGRAFRYGQRHYVLGFPCPADPAGAEGWHEQRAFQIGAVARGAAA